MIFATVQELEKYDTVCAGQQAGLYSTYFGRSPVLFNLITRASLVPFQFEPFSSAEEFFFIIDNDELYEKTLPQIVGGRTVERLCCELSPIQMLEFFMEHKGELSGLGIAEYWYNDLDLVLDVVRARALQWKRYLRGMLAREGSVVRTQFGPLLARDEEEFLLKMNPYHRDYQEVI
jgi:hypothetical protein